MPATCTLVTPPADPAVSPSQAKAHLRVTHGLEDDLIVRLARGAAADATAACGLGAGVGTYLATVDGFPVMGGSGCRVIRLPVRPVVSVAAVRYRDTAGVQQTLSAGRYAHASRSGRVYPVGDGWPATDDGPESVEVEFTAGLSPAACPPQLVDAILLILGDRYHHRGDGDDRLAVPAAALRLLWQLHSGEVV